MWPDVIELLTDSSYTDFNTRGVLPCLICAAVSIWSITGGRFTPGPEVSEEL